jgi:hypothetical protein
VDLAQSAAMSMAVLRLEVTQVAPLAEVQAEMPVLQAQDLSVEMLAVMLEFQALPVEMQVVTQAHQDLAQSVLTAMQASMPAWLAA